MDPSRHAYIPQQHQTGQQSPLYPPLPSAPVMPQSSNDYRITVRGHINSSPQEYINLNYFTKQKLKTKFIFFKTDLQLTLSREEIFCCT